MADENTGKIYIIVTDKLPNGETPTPEGVKNPSEKDKDEGSLFSHWAKNQMLGLIKQTATQAVNYSINNIGNFTGNYESQAQINNAMKTLNSTMRVGYAILSGAKYGPYGALIAGAVAATSEFMNSLYEMNSIEVSIKKQNYQTNLIRERSGLNEYIDGSRGTLY